MGSNLFCSSEYVEFLEENDQGESESIKKYCGDDLPAIYVSTRSKIQVHYIQTRNFPGTGWVMNFMGVHEGKISK
jgi:CUB domain